MNLCLMSVYSWLCVGNLGIPRIDMPQLNSSVLQEFINTHPNISSLCNTVSPSTLIPIQSEIDLDKVMKLIQLTNSGVYNACHNPIITASGNMLPDVSLDDKRFIVDGHHRWAACSLTGKNIRTINFFVPVSTLLQFMHKFPGVEHYNL